MGERGLRVAVWGTGGVGAIAVRSVHARPDMELCGVWVHSPEKDGRDAGELAGIDPIGLADCRPQQDDRRNHGVQRRVEPHFCIGEKDSTRNRKNYGKRSERGRDRNGDQTNDSGSISST